MNYEEHCDKTEGERTDLPAPEQGRTIDEIHADSVEAMAKKIAALPLSRQLWLSIQLEKPSMSLVELKTQVAELLPVGTSFQLEVQYWKHSGSESVDWNLWVDSATASKAGLGTEAVMLRAHSPEELLIELRKQLAGPVENPKPHKIEDVDIGF